MADKEPLLCREMLGALRPVTAAAEEAIRATKGQLVRLEIKRTTGNTRRMALYWVVLRIAAEHLSDAFDGAISPRSLHRWLKRDFGLAAPIVSKKTGEIIDYDYESISFETMPENERSEFINHAFERLSARIGCEVTTLLREAERETAPPKAA